MVKELTIRYGLSAERRVDTVARPDRAPTSNETTIARLKVTRERGRARPDTEVTEFHQVLSVADEPTTSRRVASKRASPEPPTVTETAAEGGMFIGSVALTEGPSKESMALKLEVNPTPRETAKEPPAISAPEPAGTRRRSELPEAQAHISEAEPSTLAPIDCEAVTKLPNPEPVTVADTEPVRGRFKAVVPVAIPESTVMTLEKDDRGPAAEAATPQPPPETLRAAGALALTAESENHAELSGEVCMARAVAAEG